MTGKASLVTLGKILGNVLETLDKVTDQLDRNIGLWYRNWPNVRDQDLVVGENRGSAVAEFIGELKSVEME